MQKLVRGDLYPLEKYAEIRPQFRAKVMAHKSSRCLPLGPNATLYFEDRLTIQYQIQEMLRAEKIFEPDGIEEELAAYNPMIPDGRNWKATFMLEYDDPVQRKAELAKLIGVEDRIWVRVGKLAQVMAIADEDMDRSDADKTSSVHFVRFELTQEMKQALKGGAALAAGIDHPHCRQAADPVAADIRRALLEDLD